MSVARLVVVGAGISGLAAAWSARVAAARAGVSLDVLVLERGHEVGGKARTIVRDGWMVEGGPSGFLGGRPELDSLLRASGLADAAVPARAAAKRRFLYRAGRLREIKASPAGFARAGIMSATGPASDGRRALRAAVGAAPTTRPSGNSRRAASAARPRTG